MPDPIDPGARIGHVHLKVSDIDRALGSTATCSASRSRRSGTRPPSSPPAATTTTSASTPGRAKDGPPPAPGTTGLFHTAILYPTRAALAVALRRVIEAGVPLTGAADHGVSEALYLDDPDGNGVELYRDRPEEEWPRPADGEGVEMFTRPLDLQGLLAEAADYASAAPRSGRSPAPRGGPAPGRVHTGAAERDSLGLEQAALALALRHRPVRADHALPGDRVVAARCQDGSRLARRPRADVAVGRDQPLGHRPDPVEDCRCVHSGMMPCDERTAENRRARRRRLRPLGLAQEPARRAAPPHRAGRAPGTDPAAVEVGIERVIERRAPPRPSSTSEPRSWTSKAARR